MMKADVLLTCMYSWLAMLTCMYISVDAMVEHNLEKVDNVDEARMTCM